MQPWSLKGRDMSYLFKKKRYCNNQPTIIKGPLTTCDDWSIEKELSTDIYIFDKASFFEYFFRR